MDKPPRKPRLTDDSGDPGFDGLAALVFAPIIPLLPDAQAALDKRLGDVTGNELLALVLCIGYGLAVGYVGTSMAVGIAMASARQGVTTVRVPLQLR
jgi:hypothetical protein